MTTDTEFEGFVDMDEATYHRRPELSSTEARRILDSPARYHYRRQAGEEHKDEFDFGHALHALVLGVGREVEVVYAENWRTNAAQAAKKNAHAAGRTPMLAKDWVRAQEMAAAVHDHPVAAALLDPTRGTVEQSAFWTDPDTGVRCRCRFDKLPPLDQPGRLIVADYKTTGTGADARTFGKSAADFGYPCQASWYLDAIRVLLERDDTAFVFVVQEKDPPYLVNVLELDAYALTIGRERNRRARDLYVACMGSGVWPGYGPAVEVASLPRWFELQHEDDMTNQGAPA